MNHERVRLLFNLAAPLKRSLFKFIDGHEPGRGQIGAGIFAPRLLITRSKLLPANNRSNWPAPYEKRAAIRSQGQHGRGAPEPKRREEIGVGL